MNPSDYQKAVAKTEALPDERLMERFDSPQTIRLLHAAMGLATEAGELVDALKKHLFYGKELDMANVREELGDSLWYVATGANALGADLGDIMQLNVNKLEARYGEGFTEEAAINRDLGVERTILESGPFTR